MQAFRNLRPILVVLALSACARHTAPARSTPPAHSEADAAPSATPSPAAQTPVAAPPPAAPTPAPRAHPSPNRQLVDAVTRALLRNNTAEAAALIDRARHAAPPAQPNAETLAYYDATVHAYQRDFRGAAQLMHDYAAKVGPTAQAAFAFHDAMIALRTATGDLMGALVECDEMVRVGEQGTWSPDERITIVRLKQHWHRAYLLRMAAQTRTGPERAAFLAYAERARQDYVALATPLKDLGDSIAVLDAYFAFCDGHPAAMRAAAQRVNVSADDDVEDLYLIQLALQAAGDPAAATAVRNRIAALPFVTVITPVFLTWMHTDDARPASPHAFSPKHPTGT